MGGETRKRDEKTTERSDEMDVHLHLRDKERGGEGAGDRRGLSPFLHPTLTISSSTVPLPISHTDERQPRDRAAETGCAS